MSHLVGKPDICFTFHGRAHLCIYIMLSLSVLTLCRMHQFSINIHVSNGRNISIEPQCSGSFTMNINYNQLFNILNGKKLLLR